MMPDATVRDYSTSWVVQDQVMRALEMLGPFRRSEWRYFIWACGLTYDFDYLPDKCNALLNGTEIIFRQGISVEQIELSAFEEACQSIFLPDVDIREWKRCPGGQVMIRKLKRRARGFAKLFPVGADDEFG